MRKQKTWFRGLSATLACTIAFSQPTLLLAGQPVSQNPVGVTDDYKKQQELQKKNAQVAFEADLAAAIGYGVAGALCSFAYGWQSLSAHKDVEWCKEAISATQGAAAKALQASASALNTSITTAQTALQSVTKTNNAVNTAIKTYMVSCKGLSQADGASKCSGVQDIAGCQGHVSAACMAACQGEAVKTATTANVDLGHLVAMHNAIILLQTLSKAITTQAQTLGATITGMGPTCEAVIRGGSDPGIAAGNEGKSVAADAAATQKEGSVKNPDASCPAEGPGYESRLAQLRSIPTGTLATMKADMASIETAAHTFQTEAIAYAGTSAGEEASFTAMTTALTVGCPAAGADATAQVGGSVASDSPAATSVTLAASELVAQTKLTTASVVSATTASTNANTSGTLAKSQKVTAENLKLACQIAGWASKGIDVGGAILIAVQTKDATKAVLPLTTIVAQLGLELIMSDAGKPSKVDGEGCQLSAMSFIGDYLQAAIRGANAGMAKADMDKADNAMAEMKGGSTFDGTPNQTSGNTNTQSGDNSGTTGAVGAVSVHTGSGLTPKQAKTSDSIASSLATGAFAPAIKDFEKLTGVSAKQLADKVAAGAPPIETVMQAATAAPGAENAVDGITKGVEISRDQNKINDAMMQAKVKLPDYGFESSTLARHDSGGGGDSGPDMNAMMAGMMGMLNPQKAAQGPQGPQTTAAKPVAKPVQTSDGFHLPDKSLFEVVGLRYQIVANDFLSGRNLLHENHSQAPSLVPTNPYLKTGTSAAASTAPSPVKK
jgi:hypothetical protein